MWGAIAGQAAGSAAGGIVSGLWGKYHADQAWERQKKVLKNQIRWRVGDMRAAGLNPLLAIAPGGGGGAGSVPQGRGGDGGRFDYAGTMQAVASAKELNARAEHELEGAELKYAQRYGQQLMNKMLEKDLIVKDLDVTTAKQLTELYGENPNLRKAISIIQGVSPVVKRR